MTKTAFKMKIAITSLYQGINKTIYIPVAINCLFQINEDVFNSFEITFFAHSMLHLQHEDPSIHPSMEGWKVAGLNPVNARSDTTS